MLPLPKLSAWYDKLFAGVAYSFFLEFEKSAFNSLRARPNCCSSGHSDPLLVTMVFL
jgi:hypothetical protein